MVLGKQREAQKNPDSRWSPGVIGGAKLNETHVLVDVYVPGCGLAQLQLPSGSHAYPAPYSCDGVSGPQVTEDETVQLG